MNRLRKTYQEVRKEVNSVDRLHLGIVLVQQPLHLVRQHRQQTLDDCKRETQKYLMKFRVTVTRYQNFPYYFSTHGAGVFFRFTVDDS